MRRIIISGFLLMLVFGQIMAQAESSSQFGLLPQSGLNLRLNDVDPSILMSQAWHSYHAGRLGDALIYAREVNRVLGHQSEAHYLIGLVFRAEGEMTLAEHHFLRAIEHKHADDSGLLYVFGLLYVYLATENHTKYFEYLNRVVNGHNLSSDQQAQADLRRNQRQQARLVLFQEGLDRVIDLYRWPASANVVAVEALGQYYYNLQTAEALELAIEYFLYATVMHAGVLISHMQSYWPDYRFRGLEILLADARRYEETRNYIERSDFYGTLFFLAAAIYAYNGSGLSRSIWNSLRQQPEESIWVRRAHMRFLNPDSRGADIGYIIHRALP